jgi:hypothetical protein
MAFWFYRGLRRGIATTRYPNTVDGWARALPSPPAFHSARLTVQLVDRLIVECPGGAVQPSGEFELATSDRSALVKRVPIRGRTEEHVGGD